MNNENKQRALEKIEDAIDAIDLEKPDPEIIRLTEEALREVVSLLCKDDGTNN